MVNAIFSDTCKVRNPCKNGATCKPDGDDTTCQCPPNYQGENCDQGRHRIKVIQLQCFTNVIAKHLLRFTNNKGKHNGEGDNDLQEKLDWLSTQQEEVYALFRHFFKVV